MKTSSLVKVWEGKISGGQKSHFPAAAGDRFIFIPPSLRALTIYPLSLSWDRFYDGGGHSKKRASLHWMDVRCILSIPLLLGPFGAWSTKPHFYCRDITVKVKFGV